jgi:hypothetical protein
LQSVSVLASSAFLGLVQVIRVASVEVESIVVPIVAIASAPLVIVRDTAVDADKLKAAVWFTRW